MTNLEDLKLENADKNHFHLNHFGPCEPYWPHGGWSAYAINGDEIAQRVYFDVAGKVIARLSWSGYLGMWETLEEATVAIEAYRKSSGAL